MDIFYTTSKRKITNQLIQFRSSKHKEWKWSGVRQKTKMTAASSSWGISKHILVVAWTSHQSSVLKEWVIFKFMCLYKYWLHVLNLSSILCFLHSQHKQENWYASDKTTIGNYWVGTKTFCSIASQKKLTDSKRK